jgi:hypothetical protein
MLKYNKYIITSVGDWDAGYINYLQAVTTNNCYTIADLHNLQSLRTNLLSLFPLVFAIRFLATDL